MRRQSKQPRDELIVDNFAGGGGASTGIEMALRRSPDVAINHDPVALAMHRANHPLTRHYATDVFEIDPYVATRNKPVGLAWFSPDCKHFSKAKGGAPVSPRVRGLAWVVIKWALLVRPRVIILENVEEFQTWGPVLPTGQPCPARKGKTFRLWVSKLKRLGYAVEWRELRGCDYGAPTIRRRLFVVARCDGRPIVWPEPTHSKNGAQGLEPWRSAASIIDWSLPCPSIFLTAEGVRGWKPRVIRPLKPATLRRIAAGVMRYVVRSGNPFLVSVNHGDSGSRRWFPLEEPMRTVTGSRSEALIAPCFDQQFGTSRGASVTNPVGTITASGSHHAVVAAHLTYGQHGGSNSAASEPLHTVTASSKDQNCLIAAHVVTTGYGERDGQQPRARSVDDPATTAVAGGCKQGVVAAFMAQHNGGVVGHDARSPLSTLTSVATQQQVVTAALDGSPDRRRQVWAFLQEYYSLGGQHQDCREPLNTVTVRDRFGLVIGDISDIGMRMLMPRELFAAQGFPPSYRIDVVNPATGKRLTKSEQTRCVGNSVCPQVAAALVAANVPELAVNPVPQRRQMELMV